MANRAWMNFGHFYTNLTSPNMVSCNFIVDQSNGNGLGIRSLKSNGYVKNVYMNTSSSPASGNPNPQAGNIVIHLADNYARSICGMNALISPLSGSNLAVNASALTAGHPYVIVLVGTTTAAQWASLGVPAGVTPAVGVSFIAAVTGLGGGGSGLVQAPSNSGITNFETIGDPNLSIGPQGVSNQGAWIIIQCLKNDVLTQPAQNTVIALSFLLDSSSVNVDGL